MAKYKIAVGLPCQGNVRVEVATWLFQVATQTASDLSISEYIDDTLVIPVMRFPTSVARNLLVKTCQAKKVDFLFMVDEDAKIHPDWFKSAFIWLKNHVGPAVIAAPYCTGGDHEQVNVFEFVSPNNTTDRGFVLKRVQREDAARRKGVKRVANIGTHAIAYTMSCFDKIEPPYFEYAYNPDETECIETEECGLHRKLYFAEVPIFCNWNTWCGHYKTRCVNKPLSIEWKDIQERYQKEACAEMNTHKE